jgi:hypothetical protein
MFGLHDLTLDFLTDQAFLVWPALLVLLGLAVLLYRRTNPPIPPYLRILLTALRMVAIVALVLALLEPVLGFSRIFERSRSVTVLIDRSSSMSKIEQGQSRQARLDSLLSSPVFERLRSQTSSSVYYFGGNLTESSGEVVTDRTALGDALRELERQELGAAPDYRLVFSDGRSNAGEDAIVPARGSSTPVIAIDMSLDAGEFDVGIHSLEHNPVVFAGQPTEVALGLAWHTGQDRTVTVELKRDNQILDRQTLTIRADAARGDIVLKYTPQQPGQQLLTVNIVPLPEEETADNNQRSFACKVLKSRMLVAIVTNQPDYEVGFLKRFLDKSDKYEVELIVMGSKSGNISQRLPTTSAGLNRYDLIVLHDPDPQLLQSRKEILHSYLADKGGAVWVMMGRRYAARGPTEWFDNLLPFAPSRRGRLVRQEFRAEPAEGNLFHPTLRLGDDRSAIRAAWADLPPFQSLVPCDQIAPDAVVLARVAGSGDSPVRLPVLGYRRVGPGKVLASAGLPFWPWGFVSLGLGEDDANYGRFLEGTSSWLTVADDFDPVRILPEKKVFTRGESVRFDGFAYDQGFRPIPNATGYVRLESEATEDPIEADLIAVREGAYAAEFSGLAPGAYKYQGRFDKDGRLLREVSGEILVESFSLEEYDRRGNPALLTALAQESGGKYYRAEDFDRAVEDLDLAPAEIKTTSELPLWGAPWLLLTMILALATEWILRKVNQLI